MAIYVVLVSGHGAESFEAETAAKARYQAFVALHDVWPGTFREFLDRVDLVYRSGPPTGEADNG